MRPRPSLTDLGITYRRMPVNSIGKDVYCDNRIFLDAVQSIFADKALPTCPSDPAYEALGYRSFWIALPLIPAGLITPEVAKDREDLFAIFGRPDFADLRPNGLAEFRSVVDMLENECLVPGPWIGGPKCSVADMHAIWVVKWAFQTLGIGSEPGFSKEDFPKVYAWIEGLPAHDEANEAVKISPEEAKEKLLNSEYAASEIGVDPEDATGLRFGMMVNVATNDE
jgi:glutathione S-transferase